MRNLQVLNPTMTTLNVRWEPAEGRVKEYKVVYVPAAGGAESMVGLVGPPLWALVRSFTSPEVVWGHLLLMIPLTVVCLVLGLC